MSNSSNGNSSEPLRWLQPLLSAKFFHSCDKHPHLGRNECNLYCLECAEALCCPCTIDHRNHRMFQIRRSSYHNVIRVSEIQKVLDISGVQTYIINSARVVFLNQRPQPKPAKVSVKTCEICDRTLLQSYRYCSLGCKVAGMIQLNEKFQPRASKLKRPSAANKETLSQYHRQHDVEGLEEHKQVEFRDVARTDDKNDNDDTTTTSSSETSFSMFMISPPTPSHVDNIQNPKRRKGVPHRAPSL